jgi:hypothetical protein
MSPVLCYATLLDPYIVCFSAVCFSNFSMYIYFSAIHWRPMQHVDLKFGSCLLNNMVSHTRRSQSYSSMPSEYKILERELQFYSLLCMTMKHDSHTEIAGSLYPNLRDSCFSKRGRDTRNHATRKCPFCDNYSFTTAFNLQWKMSRPGPVKF